ncbi:hypothetical protein [Beggiatoa leptomitoformis]|uniref:Transposase n=1 Tax=Beggiatoa leptomitoformis TaxID=288004 RepID=A0A650GCT6_9GAMM|nr:hypothetical protein [Beggiatoa leptomitoformis]QGX03574.1 hypothetical protein AL038_18625 [Beggiatoa leptomitoformis]QGX04060.1 hypothetical protein BLE401_18515 [Beggiatoa leptomitoformis]
MTYSPDFHRKVLATKEEENLTLTAVTKCFKIAIASVVRWSKVLEVTDPVKLTVKP